MISLECRFPASIVHTLSHNHRAHEDLDRSDAFERNLSLASGLVESELVSQLILTDSIWVVNLVTENDEWDLGELLHGEESIELSLGLDESVMVLGVDEEDNTGDLWEVVLPQSAGCGRTG
jgi:hypothetical protein